MDYTEIDERGCDWERTEGGCATENSVGTLVWVRRRNGHWWPGRVLAAHEVPRLHLLAPKSGTPVKLLGKDDASVDWYNIGKSRRIKAFRCGEFDDCIERARSFGCLRSKNREKYARRDDAILHALELEKRQAEGMHNLEMSLSAAPISGPPNFPNHLTVKDDLNANSHCNGPLASLESRRCALVQAAHLSNPCNSPQREPSTKFEADNGVSEVIPRMRDLQDIGLQVTSSKTGKKKCRNVVEACLAENDTVISDEGKVLCRSLPGASFAEDGNNKIESCLTRLTAGVSSTPSVTKTSSMTVQKRKKHPTGSSADESSYKKRDRRRPLTQVLKKSSNKVAVLGRERSGLLLSTTDCHMRVYCSDGTEATSSQYAFEQETNEFRPSSGHREFDSQARGHHSSYGLKLDCNRPLMNTDKVLTSFWSNCWDSGGWPSLVSAHMDFGLLLGSSYMDSIYEGTKSASCFPGVAYTGSATSVNTSDFHNSDSFKYLQGNSSISDAVGNETHDSKSTDCAQKDKQECEAFCSLSKWQVKRRRNVRKSSRYMGAEYIKGTRSCEDQDSNAQRRASGSMYTKPLREKKLNLLVNTVDRPRNSIKRVSDCERVTWQNMCHSSMHPKSNLSCDKQRQGFHWVNVGVEFDGSRKESGKMMSLFSEVMNRVVLGYPISVQILGNRVGASTAWRKGQLKSAGRQQKFASRVPRCPRHTSLNQSSGRDSVCKSRSKYGVRKPSRKSGSVLQKTRTLSSLGPTDYAVVKDHELRHGGHGAVPTEVSKAPLVTCIPVHLVFQRIREVIYKEPDSLVEKNDEEVTANRDL